MNKNLTSLLPDTRFVFSIGLVWWILVFVMGAIALHTIPFTNTFANYSVQLEANLPIWIERWANFDGSAYLTISESGYTKVGLIQAYFPGYPLLIRAIYNLTIEIAHLFGIPAIDFRILVALSTSFVFFLLFLVYFDRYLAERFAVDVRRSILLSFLLFPTSFFLHGIYTESMFLFLLVYCLYTYQQKKWIQLSIGLVFLTATRVVGVFLVPALLLDLYVTSTPDKKISVTTFIKFLAHQYKQIILISIGAIGLLGYMWYLYLTFSDPLLFFHVQSAFGAGRQQNLVLFPQVVWRYFKIFWTARPFDWKYFTYVQEFTVTMIVLLILISSLYKKKNLRLTIAELIFSFCAFFLPTLTGNFSSMARYILVCIPCFIVIGQFLSDRKIAKIAYILICLLLSIINIILFIQGRWVA